MRNVHYALKKLIPVPMKARHKTMPFNALPEHMQFLRRLIASPRSVGAIAPSGHILARAMVEPIDVTAGAVLELGPGPGAFTRAVLDKGLPPGQLTVVERDSEFVSTIRQRFPGVNIIHGDALHLSKVLPDMQFAAAMSGLPLLNFPVPAREALVRDVLARLTPGAPFIQFSYGMNSPVAASAEISVTRAAFVWNNLPPARVWVYRRNAR